MMSERRPGFFWPLGWPVFLAAGGVVFLITLARTMPVLSWQYQGWAETNSVFERFAIDFTAPAAAAFAAYLSGRLTPPTRPFALPRFSRDTAAYLAQAIIPASLVVTVGYLLALVPVIIQTYRTATWGTLDLAALATGVLVLNTEMVLGWLLGLLLQSALAAPLAFVLGYAATVVGYVSYNLNFITPVIAESGAPGREMPTEFRLLRIAFFFLVLVVALLTASGHLSTRDFSRRLPRIRHAALWLVPMALLVGGLVRPLPGNVRSADPPRACKQETGIKFCVHQADAKALDALIADVSPVVERVGADNVGFDQVHDWALSDGMEPQTDPRVYYVSISAEWGVADSGSTLARKIAGSEVCATRPGRTESPQEFNAFMLSMRIEGDREERPDNRFAKLTDEQLRQWLVRHRGQVDTCDITDDLLP
jgi:hypothetical protein